MWNTTEGTHRPGGTGGRIGVVPLHRGDGGQEQRKRVEVLHYLDKFNAGEEIEL